MPKRTRRTKRRTKRRTRRTSKSGGSIDELEPALTFISNLKIQQDTLRTCEKNLKSYKYDMPKSDNVTSMISMWTKTAEECIKASKKNIKNIQAQCSSIGAKCVT